MPTCRRRVWRGTDVKKRFEKKCSAPCRCSVIQSTQPLPGPVVFYHFSNLSVSAWEPCIPHPTPPELLLQWFARVRSSPSSHVWFKLDLVLTRLGFVLYLEERERTDARCPPDESDKQLMGKKIIGRGKKREMNKHNAKTDKVGRVAAEGSAYVRFTHLHQTDWHICRYIATHAETKNNKCWERDGPHFSSACFTQSVTHTKMLKRRPSYYETCTLIIFDSFFHQIKHILRFRNMSVQMPTKTSANLSVCGDGRLRLPGV